MGCSVLLYCYQVRTAVGRGRPITGPRDRVRWPEWFRACARADHAVALAQTGGEDVALAIAEDLAERWGAGD